MLRAIIGVKYTGIPIRTLFPAEALDLSSLMVWANMHRAPKGQFPDKIKKR